MWKLSSSLLLLAAVCFREISAGLITYDCNGNTGVPNICINYCWAVNCMGHPAILHGGANVDANANRQAAGTTTKQNQVALSQGYGWKTADGRDANSPDEYPLASSAEGGRIWNGISISIREVLLAEQSSQGGSSSGIGTSPPTEQWTFQLNNLDAMGDGFPDYCDAANTQCINDGRQFTYTAGGEYVRSLANRRRSLVPVEFEA